MPRQTTPKTAAGFTERLARNAATHPWRTVGIWVTIIVVAVLSMSSLLSSGLTSGSNRHANWSGGPTSSATRTPGSGQPSNADFATRRNTSTKAASISSAGRSSRSTARRTNSPNSA